MAAVESRALDSKQEKKNKPFFVEETYSGIPAIGFVSSSHQCRADAQNFSFSLTGYIQLPFSGSELLRPVLMASPYNFQKCPRDLSKYHMVSVNNFTHHLFAL